MTFNGKLGQYSTRKHDFKLNKHMTEDDLGKYSSTERISIYGIACLLV